MDRNSARSQDISWRGRALQNWTVFPLPLDDLSGINWQPLRTDQKAARTAVASSDGSMPAAEQLLQAVGTGILGRTLSSAEESEAFAPTLYRGSFSASASLRGPVAGEAPQLPDTFLRTPGFTKGVAFVNGFNLGWYWPAVGPQLTLYIPGPVLRDGTNALVLLEMEGAPDKLSVELVEEPDFHFHAAHRHQASTIQQMALPMSRPMTFAEKRELHVGVDVRRLPVMANMHT